MKKLILIFCLSSFSCEKGKKKIISDFCNKSKQCYPVTDLEDCIRVYSDMPDFVDLKDTANAAKMNCDDVSAWVAKQLDNKQ